MQKKSFAMRKPLIGFAVVATSCLLVAGVWSVNASRFPKAKPIQAQKRITLRNETVSLEITKAELDGKQVRVAVKNVSNKNIDWFRLSLGASSSIEADFAFADKSALAPGEIYEDLYPFDSASDEVRLTVLSVMFEDKTSDGNLHYAQLLKDKRAGQKVELNRLLPLLQRAINAPDHNQAANLMRNLETELIAIQQVKDESVPEAKWIGFLNARDRVLNELRRIQALRDEDNGRDIRKDLKLMKEHYEKITARMPD
jgi:hypothetical protein